MMGCLLAVVRFVVFCALALEAYFAVTLRSHDIYVAPQYRGTWIADWRTWVVAFVSTFVLFLLIRRVKRAPAPDQEAPNAPSATQAASPSTLVRIAAPRPPSNDTTASPWSVGSMRECEITVEKTDIGGGAGNIIGEALFGLNRAYGMRFVAYARPGFEPIASVPFKCNEAIYIEQPATMRKDNFETVTSALRTLDAKLTKDGWQPGGRGSQWYALRYRR